MAPDSRIRVMAVEYWPAGECGRNFCAFLIMNRRRPAIIKVRRMFKTKLRMQLELMNLKNGASGVSSVDGTSVEAHSPSTAETKTSQ
jgi:predicted RNA polymerase sigma factor